MDLAVNPTRPPSPSSSLSRRHAHPKRRNGSDELVILWLPDQLHIAVSRRQKVEHLWSSAGPISSSQSFAEAIDIAMEQGNFAGNQVIVVLHHPRFVQRYEVLPPLKSAQVRTLLNLRGSNLDGSNEQMLWAAETLWSPRNELPFLIHQLPLSTYGEINEVLADRRLDLSRLVPLSATVFASAAELKADEPVLVLQQFGGLTCLIALHPSGKLLVARVMRVDWQTELHRLAVEANRAFLFIKQRYTLNVGRIHVLGATNDAATAELARCCPKDIQVTSQAWSLEDNVAVAARLSRRISSNLLDRYHARRRLLARWRFATIALLWVAVAAIGLFAWNIQDSNRMLREHYRQLAKDAPFLTQERDRLIARNTKADADRRVSEEISGLRPPNIPVRAINAVVSTLPEGISLSECAVRFDPSLARWTIRISGSGSEPTGATLTETVQTWQTTLRRQALRFNFPEGFRGAPTNSPSPGAGTSTPRFTFEGTFLEP